MKEMIKKIREEKGGFTLAELLIVVAIVLVLVAIAVPVFTGALDKANEAVKAANIRSIKSEASAMYLLTEADAAGTGLDAIHNKYYGVDGEGNVTGPLETKGSADNTTYYQVQAVVGADKLKDVTITVTEA